MPERQLEDLKKILVPALVCLLAVVLQIVALMMFGDLEIGEPNVTKADIPALTFILLGVGVIVVSCFLMTRRMSNFVDFYETDSEEEDEQSTPFFTWAIRAFILLFIAAVWPDKWNPLPERIVETSILYIGIGVAIVAAAVAIVTRQKMDELRG